MWVKDWKEVERTDKSRGEGSRCQQDGWEVAVGHTGVMGGSTRSLVRALEGRSTPGIPDPVGLQGPDKLIQPFLMDVPCA